jgi:hypothetical protein
MERFKADQMTEADKQLIAVLLSGIAADQDVRDYFWHTPKHRPKKHNPLKYWAAVVAALAEARGEKLDKVRKGHAVEATGLTDGKVDHAIREHGANARFHVELFSDKGQLDQLEQWAETEIAKLRGK